MTAQGRPRHWCYPSERNSMRHRLLDLSLQRGLSAPVCQAFRTGLGRRWQPPNPAQQPLRQSSCFPEKSSHIHSLLSSHPQEPRPGAHTAVCVWHSPCQMLHRPERQDLLRLFQGGEVLRVHTAKFMPCESRSYAQVICRRHRVCPTPPSCLRAGSRHSDRQASKPGHPHPHWRPRGCS